MAAGVRCLRCAAAVVSARSSFVRASTCLRVGAATATASAGAAAAAASAAATGAGAAKASAAAAGAAAAAAAPGEHLHSPAKLTFDCGPSTPCVGSVKDL